MIYLKNDYSLGAHPQIMQALSDTNMIHTTGYGEDPFCEEARRLLKKQLAADEADIHFLMGGTQTNLTAMAAFLRPHHAIIAADSAHICVHETGAIEATGHKVIACPSPDGKLLPQQIEDAVLVHKDEHMVKPKLVYISNTTEVGTVYDRDELQALRSVCDKYGLYLYLDGARLGCALTAPDIQLTLADLARLTDAFYIGGTKNGVLFGEALAILNPELKEDFRYHIKQRGGMMAKGRLLGIQFRELFKDGLYFDLARHANEMAQILKNGIIGGGYEFFVDSPTNQIFPILPNMVADHLRELVSFEDWQPYGDRATVIRLVTSWGTTEDEIMEFLRHL
ncbi:low specificity L-threonine aldolase [Anaerovorax odorimutans]|uniref:Low specificity L-threonine aldolase n=1 Tax=Anaerovorax odorimutans TaxID=109327 RepID=A0ABT1RTG6_9FIRM|nr:low specificity L-threonine aldolase [Anaerovorax odorimutans]MCQ4638156.1 low specificity L-threonine aldolase [Anaerovorax odorimutans]